MPRLEPGDINHACFVAYLAKANERVHFVDVTMHRVRQGLDTPNERVGGYRQQLRLASRDAPEQLVQHGEPMRVAVANHRFGEFHEAAGDA